MSEYRDGFREVQRGEAEKLWKSQSNNSALAYMVCVLKVCKVRGAHTLMPFTGESK